ncbi:PAS domain S-box protein [Anabaena sp. UHCC 0451]|uniref:PAS domain S-box protein n=1 Tax=Anabaena sp. UHCC 0451 TaxID=2055235 RepID=UPI002B211F9D|nr:PAS domain S-box protein [Anabaena sp. UHCC 0451]MEA5578393.1 PAS domain S-box protein [Anabaena sp. UHCC 0451]
MSAKFFSASSDIKTSILNCPLTLTPETPAIEAVRLMSQVRDTCHLITTEVTSDVNLLNHAEKASCVLVVENKKLVGIFTERDIVRSTAMGLDLVQVTLAEVMCQNPVTLRKSDFTNIFVVLNLFRQHKIRHLAIVDDQDHLIGLVTPTTVRQLLQAADLLKIRTIGEAMTSEVIQSPPTTSVLELAQLMAEHSVSCVVITESDSQPIGIVTERDIVQMRALELDILDIQAHIVMSAPLFYMRSQQSLWDAHQQMQQRRIRRLVVVGDRDELLGIITQTSVLYSLDPLEMYEAVNFLQKKVYQLESQKVEILQKQKIELETQVQQRTLKLIEQANADKLLANLSQKIRKSLDIESILQSAVSEIRGYLQTDRVVIYQFEPKWTGRIVAESLAPEKTSLLGRVINDPCFGTNWVETYTNGRVRKIEDIHASGLTDCHIELLEKAEIYANLIVPIVYNEQLWGLLCAHQCSQPRYWETLEVELLEKLATQIAIAIQQSQLYQQAQQELLERQRMEEALRNIALGVSTQTGEVFFHSLVRYLSKALAVDYAIVARLVNSKTDYMETVAVWANGQIVENFECSIQHNPCYNTIRYSNQSVCIYPSQVQREFPLDPKLSDMQAEGYMGMTIYDSTGQAIGILAVLSRHPLHDIEFMSEILKIFSMQVASELQRTQAEVALKKLNEELEIRIVERTAELEKINEDLLLEIQERQRVEEILQKQLTAIEATIDGIAILKDEKYTFLNKSHVQLFGYNNAKELIGKNWREMYPPEEIKRLEREVLPILIQAGHWQGEAIARRRDGSTFHEQVSLTLTKDGELICVCRDITETKQAELQLQKLLLELSDFKYALDQCAIVAITDSQGKITYANDKFCEISQYSRAELIGSTHKIINSGYHSLEYFQKIWSTIIKGQVWSGEIKNRAKNGTYYWVDTTIVPFLDESGKPWQYLAIRNNITNRRQTQSDLQESEQKFRQLAENLNQVFWMTDPETSTMIYISPAYEEIWGRSCQSLYENPKSFIDAIYADDRQQFLIAIQNKKQGFDIEYRIIRPDGSMRWIRDQAFPLTNKTGEVYRVIGIAEDITKNKEAAVALEESQNFLRQVIDTNPNLIFVIDLQGRFVLANQALADIYGTTVTELIGKTNADLNPNADEMVYLNSINQEVRTTLQSHIIPEIKIITATGETRYFQTIQSPLIAADGKAYQMLGVLTDITERKQAEQEISKALEREKELGELKSRFVSMTSHEFRTPLTVIASSAGILKDFGHKLDDKKKRGHLECIQTYVKHTTQLLDDILLINKAETGNLAFNPVLLDLIPFCQKLTEEIQLSTPNHTIVFSSHSQGNASGNFDKKLLRQILINLLSNAIKYSPHNAIVKFEFNIAASNAIFSVQDQGIGIPETDQVKLFESFHRARNVGNIPGTGLGLSIVAKCIDLHKGSIAVNSQVGMGTTFIVTIPLQSATFVQ